MSFIKELNLLIKARYPLIYISSLEEERIEYTIKKNLKLNNRLSIYSWDYIEGYKIGANKEKFAIKNPLQALEFIENLLIDRPCIFILKDFNKFLSDILISRKIRNLLDMLKKKSKTVIIVGNEIEITTELINFFSLIEFPLPKNTEIKSELCRLAQSIEKEFNKEFLENLTFSCQGLSLEQIRRTLSKSIVKYGLLNVDTIDLVIKEKSQMINQSKILEFYHTQTKFSDIGGLENLKKWLNIRKESFKDKAKLYGLPSPRGILLTGIQGTGKSLVAKTIANEWNLPLLKLDMGKIFAGIIGESENRVRQMIRLSEALAPCIIWIDEIDKAFNEQTKSFDSGTSDRVLGTFITWLSEKKSKVFIVGTANNFSVLPLELIRKGRFDEIFFLGLPNFEERVLIIKVIIKNLRPHSDLKLDFEKLALKCKGFSGAEIKQAIVEGMFNGFIEKREFGTKDMIDGIKNTVPLIEIDTKRIKQIQTHAITTRIRLASDIEKDL